VLDKFGRIDILVNNAGASPAMVRCWIRTNACGIRHQPESQRALLHQPGGRPGDEEAGGGRIINIASIDGFKPEPGVSIYSISKAGVRMVTRLLPPSWRLLTSG